MSTTIINDPMVMSAPETQPPAVATKLITQIEVEFAICDCCGLTEECTPAYIALIRERYHGKWICGLCSEAIKDEIMRSERLISTEEAITNHFNFCKTFKSSEPPTNPTVDLIAAMRQILRRSLDSPRGMRSAPTSPVKGDQDDIHAPGCSRSGSCFSSLSGS